MASMYLRGEGVAHDPKNALRWERAAAEQGDPFAQYGLGLLYYIGEVIARDAKSAYDWISKAMAGGSPITLDLAPGWKVGHYAIDTGQGELLEFVRSDDDVESWQELVTIQRFPSNWGGTTPQASLDKLIASREKTCAGATTWSTIAKDDNSVLYEWRSFPCAAWPSQHEIAKIIYRRDARIFLHYANKQYDMPGSNRSTWMQRFSAAQ